MDINVLLVDDHELVRMGLKALLEKESGIKIIGEATSGEQAIRVVREKKPDIVLMDVKMPGIGGLEATRRLMHSYPDVRIIAVTSCHDDPYPSRLMQTGASGFVAKDSASVELADAIRKVYTGQRYVSTAIAQQMALKTMARNGNEASDTSPLTDLSERELQVLLMVSVGAKIQKIADKLCITSKTVNTYRYRLYEKLGVETDVELALLAIRHGLVDLDNDKKE